MQSQIDISKMSGAELHNLRKALLAMNKADKSSLERRNLVIDKMLTEKEDGEFKHTTRDIVTGLQKAGIVKTDAPKIEIQDWMKKVQTRKQLLEKQVNEDGSLKHKPGTFGYKSSGVFGSLTADRVIDWLMVDENVAKLTAADKAAILKQLK